MGTNSDFSQSFILSIYMSRTDSNHSYHLVSMTHTDKRYKNIKIQLNKLKSEYKNFWNLLTDGKQFLQNEL